MDICPAKKKNRYIQSQVFGFLKKIICREYSQIMWGLLYLNFGGSYIFPTIEIKVRIQISKKNTNIYVNPVLEGAKATFMHVAFCNN